MKKFIILTLLAVMSIKTPVIAAPAAEQTSTSEVKNLEDSLIGDWYGCPYGVPMKLIFDADAHTYTWEKITQGMTETGTWSLDGKTLTLDEDDNVEMVFTYDDDKKMISATVDGLKYVFVRDSKVVDEVETEKINKNAKKDDFAGKWKAVQVSSGEITVPLNVLGVESFVIDVKDDALDMKAEISKLEKSFELTDIPSNFKDGAVTFDVALANSITGTGKLCILEDGTMNVDVEANGVHASFLMQKA